MHLCPQELALVVCAWPLVRRAAWWVVVWVGLVTLWAIGLIDKGGRYPWEGEE